MAEPATNLQDVKDKMKTKKVNNECDFEGRLESVIEFKTQDGSNRYNNIILLPNPDPCGYPGQICVQADRPLGKKHDNVIGTYRAYSRKRVQDENIFFNTTLNLVE